MDSPPLLLKAASAVRAIDPAMARRPTWKALSAAMFADVWASAAGARRWPEASAPGRRPRRNPSLGPVPAAGWPGRLLYITGSYTPPGVKVLRHGVRELRR